MSEPQPKLPPTMKFCPDCQVLMRALNSRRIEDYQQRRMECPVCKHRETIVIHGKWIRRRGQ